jgi:Leucine-rich repeat (LRR) protein
VQTPLVEDLINVCFIFRCTSQICYQLIYVRYTVSTLTPHQKCTFAVLANMLPLLLFFLPLVYGTESPLCAECDCQLGYGNLYSVNCTSDVTNLFEGWYWIDPNDKTYPFKVVTIANSRLDRLDKQFPRSSMESLSLLNCHITYISESTFGKLAYLEKLILSHNRIENLHPKAFAVRLVLCECRVLYCAFRGSTATDSTDFCP